MCYVHNQWYDISCATLYYVYYADTVGNAVTQLVQALRFKPEDGRFDSRWCNLSGRTMTLGL